MSDQQGSDIPLYDQVGKPRIAVIGVGGAGGNAVNNMIQADLEGVEFWIANTDAQAIDQSLCDNRIQLGAALTKGLGAGSRPEIGQAAAEETKDAISHALNGANMAFITAGMGGGTGTGGAPIIAQIARQEGVLTVGVVSKPFDFEGPRRMRLAEAGIIELAKYVDTLIIIPNQNLFRVADNKTTFADAFKMADDVLQSGVRGVTDLMVLPGLVNLDFADVRSIMAGMGKAVMGTGEAEGEGRALAAAQAAISNPLLDDISMKGARSVLINITGGADLMLMEVDQAASRIREEVDPEANIIFGSAFSEYLDGTIRVSVIATGSDAEQSKPVSLTSSTPSTDEQAASAEPDIPSPEQPDDVNTSSADDSADDPVEVLVSADEPVEVSVSADDPVEVSVSADEPVEVSVSADEPVEVSLSADEPVEVSLSADEPVEVSSDKPANDSGDNPANDWPNNSPNDSIVYPDEPLTLRLVSTLPEIQPEPDAPPSFLREQHEPLEPVEPQPAERTSNSVISELLSFAEKTSPTLKTSDLLVEEGDEDLSAESLIYDDLSMPEPDAAEPAEVPRLRSEKAEAESGKLKSLFSRPAKPIKSESTQETFEKSRLQDNTAPNDTPSAPPAGPEHTHFVVWEVDLGARIYKVPEGKIATIRQQPHADRLKLFDNLDNAKAEASAIFKRVASERSAKGLPKSILEPTLEDLMRWDESKVPHYFL